MQDPTLELARELITRRSITPDDDGCQALIAGRLEAVGFSTEHIRFGEVDNLWATKGSGTPLLVFAGHTDVVPPGPLDSWNTDPFEPEIRDSLMYGRGSADMKSSLAAFVTAIEGFVTDFPDFCGSVGVLITSDEEADAIDGTVKVMEVLRERDIHIDYCVVGEPSSSERLGDTIKVGRRGSLGARLVILGSQGHIAYPDLADNPIPRSADVIATLADMKWDLGNEFFPPTSFQVSNLHSGTGATNVIPGEVIIDFNLRYSPEISDAEIRSRITSKLDNMNISYDISWQSFGEPFLTRDGTLIPVAMKAIGEVTGNQPELSTSGGTSDGRFIAPTGSEVVEIGPVNASIHKVNEHVDVSAPAQLSSIYRRIMELLLTGPGDRGSDKPGE